MVNPLLKQDFSGPESSGGGSGAVKGQKYLQNDLFGLKMARNGALNTSQSVRKTTNCVNDTNGGKQAERTLGVPGKGLNGIKRGRKLRNLGKMRKMGQKHLKIGSKRPENCENREKREKWV